MKERQAARERFLKGEISLEEYAQVVYRGVEHVSRPQLRMKEGRERVAKLLEEITAS